MSKIYRYDFARKIKVNERMENATIQDILDITVDGTYSGYIIEDGQIVGTEIYDEAE